jgi:hypothetical protein
MVTPGQVSGRAWYVQALHPTSGIDASRSFFAVPLLHNSRHVGGNGECLMAKGDQHKEKMVKKPKKDGGEPKNGTSDRPVAPVTAVAPKGKLKNKPQ